MLARTSWAAKIAMFRIWVTEADRGQICTGFDNPSSSGPITVAPPIA